ncbi:MFS transporter [Proteus sp. ZN5]|uniref:MFS transporter n=1 Tax=Proteus sp. ZN5 TaxID=2697019 RepID=UPI0013E1A669|nr:MFS transporter [Proteus sp. ZN5]QIG06267.1 MFS transporter [Proteus sp. ZN5]
MDTHEIDSKSMSLGTDISDNTSSIEKPAHRQSNPKHYIQRDDALYIKVTVSFFMVGLATFALLYFVQPILPVLSNEFSVSPATSSLALSLSTALMACGLLITGPLSDAFGRKNVMVIALFCAAFFTLLSATMNSWAGILITRALVGLSLSGVAAVAMTYLSEEIHPAYLALSMGLYISGNSIGGMSGRVITGVLSDYYSWRLSVVILGIFALFAAITFWKILPASQHFRPTALKPRNLLITTKLHFRDKGLPLLFIEGGLLMGGFVTLFNYIGYRLLDAPYSLSQTTVGLISIVYLSGTYSASKAGLLTTKYGLGKVFIAGISMMLIGILITLIESLPVIFIGMLILTTGFFAAHAVASSWVGRRAKRGRAQASSLYLFTYYAGSSLAGTVGGLFWVSFGWLGVGLFIALLMLTALLIALHLNKVAQ